jgi:hypothetical protein
MQETNAEESFDSRVVLNLSLFLALLTICLHKLLFSATSRVYFCGLQLKLKPAMENKNLVLTVEISHAFLSLDFNILNQN